MAERTEIAELFSPESVASDSPRLAWMKKHDIHVHHTATIAEPWSAWIGDLQESIERGGFDPELGGYATGNTEDEAIFALARARGIRLWNEEASDD